MSAGKSGVNVDEKLVEVGEYKVNVASTGAGPALVLLHGEEHRPSWRDWEPLLGLSDRFRLIMPDLVGFGKSSRPRETPDHKGQAAVVHELLDVMKVDRAGFAGYSWGGQVALEVALEWPEKVQGLVLVASTYDKGQLPAMGKLGKPTLIIWAEDDMVTQLKAGYLLRDAIRSSRIEVLPPVAKDPKHDFRYAHRLLTSRSAEVARLFRWFLASPDALTSEPPEIEKELRGMALKHETPDNWGTGKQG